MIPKTIHYIWFGGAPLSKLARRCIDSWKRHCPDYEIVRWDETTFDISENMYCQEACQVGKWAFASDYARLKVLFEHGGIYMDTDVEVLRSLDDFLTDQAFSGFESSSSVQTGIMGAEAGNPFVRDLLARYKTRHFILEDGSLDLTTNVTEITSESVRRGLELNNTYQVVDGFAFYPSDWFCPKDWRTKELKITANTHAIHHFDGSWVEPSKKMKQRIKNLIGQKRINSIKNSFRG